MLAEVEELSVAILSVRRKSTVRATPLVPMISTSSMAASPYLSVTESDSAA